MAIRFDYFRGGRQVSFFRDFAGHIAVLSCAVLLAVSCAAQYTGQVTKQAKENPVLRSVAVLEWTGEPGKPKASRIVPVTVLDEGQLQDGGIYMARPQPMAVTGGIEYELQQNGKPVGLFDIQSAGQVQGSWVGLGSWKPLPVAKSKPSMAELAKIDVQDEESDRPVLHRKKHAADGKGDADPAPPAAPDDPDRPKLHKKDTGASDKSDSSDTDAGRTGSTPDPDRPTLHKKSSSGSADDSTASSAPADDPDRPKLKRGKKEKPAEDIGHAEALPDVTDPDRPRLKRGKTSSDSLEVVPSVMGMPPDLQQTVAVSDAKARPEHPWTFSWTDPADEEKMKSALEDIARDALGLKPPPPPKAAPRRTATRRSVKPVAPPVPPEPIPLDDEQFRVFELAYGSGATMVLTARTGGPAAQQKFVTLVAQPDLYGNVQVLLKNVTDGAHLDEKPRMRLVDAVDVMADNRGELLFELRGASQRQFALYRVLRGQAEKLFSGGGGEYGVASNQ